MAVSLRSNLMLQGEFFFYTESILSEVEFFGIFSKKLLLLCEKRSKLIVGRIH